MDLKLTGSFFKSLIVLEFSRKIEPVGCVCGIWCVCVCLYTLDLDALN